MIAPSSRPCRAKSLTGDPKDAWVGPAVVGSPQAVALESRIYPTSARRYFELVQTDPNELERRGSRRGDGRGTRARK